jgi:hypothetical protein
MECNFSFLKSKRLADLVITSEATYVQQATACQNGSQPARENAAVDQDVRSGDSFELAPAWMASSARDITQITGEKDQMSYRFSQQLKNIAQVRRLFAAALVLASAFGASTHALAQVTTPQTSDTIAVPVGNEPFLVGHAFGSQGYTCLPTATGGTAWNPTARPEATLFSDLFGQQIQIITHFQSINANPKPGVIVPLSGNATWQGSLDSSRVWAVKSQGVDPGPDQASCQNTGSIQCLLLQAVGTAKGPTGGNLLAKTTFIQRLNTKGGAVPTTACTVGQTQLVGYQADYFFYRAAKE